MTLLIIWCVLAICPLIYIAVKLSVKSTKLAMNCYDKDALLFNPREEKVMRIAVITLYVLTIILFAEGELEAGNGLFRSLYYAAASCAVLTVLPPFGVFTLMWVVLALNNRKRKRRQREAQGSSAAAEQM